MGAIGDRNEFNRGPGSFSDNARQGTHSLSSITRLTTGNKSEGSGHRFDGARL
jgi:hypothetical protein